MVTKIIKKFFNNNTIAESKNRYIVPLPVGTKIKNILYDWPSHTGPFEGAVDFAVDVGTDVLAALDGTVIEIVDQYDKFGPSKEFASYLNYLTIAHENNEYSQYGHLKKGSVTIKLGEKVKQGQKIATTGLNGWMEEPFIEHLHFFVFRTIPNHKFIGLKINFEQVPLES